MLQFTICVFDGLLRTDKTGSTDANLSSRADTASPTFRKVQSAISFPVRGFTKKSFCPGRGYIFHGLYSIGKGIDEGCVTAAVFVNFRKAFNSVSHRLILKKLPGYGIKDNELGWFENYLTSRCQSRPSRSKNG